MIGALTPAGVSTTTRPGNGTSVRPSFKYGVGREPEECVVLSRRLARPSIDTPTGRHRRRSATTSFRAARTFFPIVPKRFCPLKRLTP